MMPVASLRATFLTRSSYTTGNTLHPRTSHSLADFTPKRRDPAFKIEGRVLERFLHHLASTGPSTWSCRSSVARSALRWGLSLLLLVLISLVMYKPYVHATHAVSQWARVHMQENLGLWLLC